VTGSGEAHRPARLEGLHFPATGSWEVKFGPARIVFGAGALSRLGELVRDLGGSLLVTDPGVRAAGHVEQAERSLQDAGIRVAVFDGVEENPTTRHVDDGVRQALATGVDHLIGLGGGSAMDCAKGINFLLTNGGKLADYWGTNLAARPLLPSVGIPTTAGTGSEVQSYALIEQEDTRRKMACGDDKARFRAVILDPELTGTQPPRVAALSGMDAISHVVESYVSAAANPISRMYAREAWELLEGTFESAIDAPAEIEPRGRMLIGAHLAGASIECSMLGAAHACANPLTSRFGVSHGAAVLLMLPHVIRFNMAAVGPLYDELLRRAARPCGSLAERVEELRERGGLPARLADVVVPRDALAELAADAAEQWTLKFNPRAATKTELQELYESAY